MSTLTAIRPQEKTGNWSAIFPQEQVTEQQSALFVKKLLAVAISNITYLRAVFPEHAFGDRNLEGLDLKILRDDTCCPGACQVIKWVKGCFEALDKKYLRMLIIGIYLNPEEENTVIESYTFKFSYTDEGGVDIYRNDSKISSAHSPAETKKATTRLLRTIIVLTQTLESLPDDVMMTMKLLYYDEATPPDYNPPGFKPSESDSYAFSVEPINIKVGQVATMRIKTDSKQFKTKDDTALEVVNEDTCNQNMKRTECDMITVDLTELPGEGEGNGKKKIAAPEQCEDIPMESPAKPNNKMMILNNKLPEDEGKQEIEFGVKCPCGCNEDDGLMILCSVCKFWQHGVCFMVLEEDDAPENHVCNDCSSLDNEGEATDPYLIGLSNIAVQATCLWRRALIACTENTRVLAATFSRRLGVEMTVCQGLLNRLEKEGFIKTSSKGKRMGKVVDKEKILSDGVQKYFKRQKPSTLPTSDQQSCKVGSNAKPKEKMFEKEPEIHKKPIITDKNENELDTLSEMTEGITLSGRKKKMPTKSKMQSRIEAQQIQVRRSPRIKPPTGSIEQPVSQIEDDQRRGKKRVIAKCDMDASFDVSNSQDIDHENGRTRKRKASDAERPIMV